MIEALRIRQLAVVDDAELEFGSGLNALTGETGAGKSLVLGALALLTGARASADLVRQGADEASVEAVFRTGGLPELESELERRGLSPDDHELVVRRTLGAAGRSRARIAGQLVPVSLLAELFGGRVEISSQHESQALLRPEAHGRLLDAFGGLLSRREAVAGAAAQLRACDQEIARLRSAAEERARRRDYLAFQVGEIDEAKLVAGEFEQLTRERSRLTHAERLREETAGAAALLVGDPAISDSKGAQDLLVDALRGVEGLAGLDPGLAELAGRLDAAAAELRDAAAELAGYAQGVEADPGRLAEIEDRLERIDRLRRKYGDGEEEILAFRDRAAAELAESESADGRLLALDGERAQRVARLERAAGSLSAGRRKAAAALGRAVESQLRALALPHAGFEVGLDPAPAPEGAPCGAGGREAPEFRFGANPGEAPRSLRRVASGGELSRLFLALKNVLRRAETGMVLLFDEIDAGTGGQIADRVGRSLVELAADHQVLCITHLPQIAALADVHLRVEKREVAGRASAVVGRLDPAGRVEEIARMAGGERVSEATRRHARELLGARRARS